VVTTTEELIKGWAKTFQNHDIIFVLSSKPTNCGNARASGKVLVKTDFVLKVIIMARFKLDSNFFP